jgi:signal transduction histidine kinase
MRWEGAPADGFATGTIRIATKSFAADAAHPELKGRKSYLSVTDTGEGMDEETLRQAREPFLTTKGTGKGTGLGYPWCTDQQNSQAARYY